jgi:hypothetical protein
VACVLHARHHGIFADRMRSVGKQARDESGKYPVNEDDEEIVRCVNTGTRDLRGVNVVRCLRTELSASLRAKRSNPSHGITDGWIASLAMTALCILAGASTSTCSITRPSASHTPKRKMPGTSPGHDAVFVDGQCDVSLRLACNRLAERGLRGGEAGDRHAIG